jgi:chitinase
VRIRSITHRDHPARPVPHFGGAPPKKVRQMQVATERPAARHARPPGTVPRPLAALAAAVLAAGTAGAMWLLPAGADPGPRIAPAEEEPPGVGPVAAADGSPGAPPTSGSEPGGAQPGGAAPEGARAGSGPSVAASPRRTPAVEGRRRPAPAVPGERPGGFLAFVDTVRRPRVDLPAEAQETGVHWYTLGHITSGADGCTPKWGGEIDQGSNPVANGLGRLRAAGGNAGLSFGGKGGGELATGCPDAERLTAAYRRVIAAFDSSHIDFEIHDTDDAATTMRRAAAIATLQREAQARGEALEVSFTLPAHVSGISPGHRWMLRATRQAGAEIRTVNLLVPLRPLLPDGGHLQRLDAAVDAAAPQIGWALGTGRPAVMGRIGLTPVLAEPGDLTAADARRLVGYAMRHDLAWLSVRGATPAPAVVQILSAARR